MLDFAQLPPEINSALMYSGPGSGPMLAAAAAWQGLATELHTTAFSYGSLITGLVDGPWQGPAATAMAAAAAPQVAWLAGTGEQAEQVAGQAVAAVAAYEAAFAATVPPPFSFPPMEPDPLGHRIPPMVNILAEEPMTISGSTYPKGSSIFC